MTSSGVNFHFRKGGQESPQKGKVSVISMSPDTKEVLLDAIKILGPALITAIIGIVSAFLAYRVGRSQAELKLKELDKTNEFKAREHLFNYYKEKGNQLRRKSDDLSKSFGKLIGYASAMGDDEKEEKEMMLTLIFDSLKRIAEIAPSEIKDMKKDMLLWGLTSIPEFALLDSYIDKIAKLETGTSISILMKNTITLSEVYTVLNSCNLELIGKRTDEIFNKYLKDESG